MHILGIDEAGYGPNLGPLVITGSVWPLPQTENPLETLTQRLVQSGAIAESLKEQTAGKGAVFVADSKIVYKSGSLGPLLDAVLSVLEPVRPESGWTSRNLFAALDPDSETALNANPWDAGYCEPLTASPGTVQKFQTALASAQLESPQLFSKVVFPQEFNENVQRLDSKGTAHACWVLGLVRRILERLPTSEEPILVLSDKLGARNRYASLICTIFEGTMVQTVLESAEKSEYRFLFERRTVNLSFQVRGERFLPVALASMTSKLLRELAMRSFNAFWQKRLSDLRETAGYPVDAKRFLAEISPLLKKYQIPESLLWRKK